MLIPLKQLETFSYYHGAQAYVLALIYVRYHYIRSCKRLMAPSSSNIAEICD